MTRQLIVTVGTSLFHSASWEADRWVLERCPGYDYWTKDSRFLTRPEARQRANSRSERIRAALADELRADNARAWAEHLSCDLAAEPAARGRAMRFGAEVATLVKLVAQTQQVEDLRGLLDAYQAVHLVADAADAGAPHVAALHLMEALNRASGVGNASLLRVPGLSSVDPDVLLGKGQGLRRLVTDVSRVAAASPVDLVITGGYKVYGVLLAGLLFQPGLEPIRLIYIHDNGDKLMIVDRRTILLEGASSPVPIPWGLE